MDWSNESYVKLYTRETDDDLALSWEALALWHKLLTKFDRSGLVLTKRGAKGLAALVRMPVEVVERVLPELLEDGRICAVDGGFCARNFLVAQEASKSDRLRTKESRERARSRKLDEPVTERDTCVTNRDESVTTRHEASQPVTLTSALPIPSPLLREPGPNELEHALDPPEPNPKLDESVQFPKRRPDLAWEVWQHAKARHAELVAEGVDAHARADAWAGQPHGEIAARIRELRERGLSPDEMRAKLLGAIDTEVASARARSTLTYFTPSSVFRASSFGLSSERSPAQVTAAAADRARAAARGGRDDDRPISAHPAGRRL